MISLYHKDLGFPMWFNTATSDAPIQIWPTRHAEMASLSDRYGSFILPNLIRPKEWTIIEIECIELEKHKAVRKLVFRKQYNNTLDITVVITWPDCMIKTAWLNRRDDIHKTLDASKYRKPQ